MKTTILSKILNYHLIIELDYGHQARAVGACLMSGFLS